MSITIFGVYEQDGTDNERLVQPFTSQELADKHADGLHERDVADGTASFVSYVVRPIVALAKPVPEHLERCYSATLEPGETIPARPEIRERVEYDYGRPYDKEALEDAVHVDTTFHGMRVRPAAEASIYVLVRSCAGPERFQELLQIARERVTQLRENPNAVFDL